MNKKVRILWMLFIVLFTNNLISQNLLTIKDIYSSSKFFEDAVKHFHWTNDGSGIVYREMSKYKLNQDFIYYDILSGEKRIIIKESELNKSDKYDNSIGTNVIWSPNEDYLLFTEKLLARKTKSGGDFFLYNIKKKTLRPVLNLDSPKMLAKFSPNSQKIGYVKDNNIFILDIDDFTEKQLTNDGAKHLLNGHFDWVYEEEFDIIEGWEWSPDSKNIAYWQIDESEVPEFEIPLYNFLYPKNIIQKYPKAGQKNSEAKIGVVNVETGRITWLQFKSNEDFYIPRIQWLNNSKEIAIVKLNRLQNQIEIYLGNVNDGKLNKIFEETDECWIKITDDLQFLNNSKNFLWTSEKSGYRHIYLNDYISSESLQLTSGDWQVRQMVAVDENNRQIYFTGTKESAIENHLYRVDFEGKNIKKLSEVNGWHDVNFSPDFKYFLDKYSNINIPTKTILCNNDGKQLTTLVENEMGILESYKLCIPEFVTIVTENNQELNGWILKPPDFDAEKKYPLLVSAYGGPGSQKVQNKWGVISYWFQLLSQNGYIVACIDNRGTEGRGANFKKSVYKKLGQLDVHDQIQAARYLASLNYIDENRVGMYGWSYGGYMAAMCLMQGSEIFKVAVAVAPVTDWKFYDTIYTERFMQTPNLNKEGYELGSVLNYVNRLTGKLLLIHGMADDNVHFQNSAELVDELIRQNKQFETMFYPNRKHGIRRGSYNTREHLYTLITEFIFENL